MQQKKLFPIRDSNLLEITIVSNGLYHWYVLGNLEVKLTRVFRVKTWYDHHLHKSEVPEGNVSCGVRCVCNIHSKLLGWIIWGIVPKECWKHTYNPRPPANSPKHCCLDKRLALYRAELRRHRGSGGVWNHIFRLQRECITTNASESKSETNSPKTRFRWDLNSEYPS